MNNTNLQTLLETKFISSKAADRVLLLTSLGERIFEITNPETTKSEALEIQHLFTQITSLFSAFVKEKEELAKALASGINFDDEHYVIMNSGEQFYNSTVQALSKHRKKIITIRQLHQQGYLVFISSRPQRPQQVLNLVLQVC